MKTGMTLAELEADARARHRCPQCRAQEHVSCTAPGVRVRYLRHPHKARTDLSRAAEAGRRQTVLIAVRALSRCSFVLPAETDRWGHKLHDARLCCGNPMTCGVYDGRNGNLLWRCEAHGHMVQLDYAGLVVHGLVVRPAEAS
jgi:hypothetical protein